MSKENHLARFQPKKDPKEKIADMVFQKINAIAKTYDMHNLIDWDEAKEFAEEILNVIEE